MALVVEQYPPLYGITVYIDTFLDVKHLSVDVSLPGRYHTIKPAKVKHVHTSSERLRWLSVIEYISICPILHIMTVLASHVNDPYDGSNNSQNRQELFDAIRRKLRLKTLYETCRDLVILILTRALPNMIGPGLYLFGTRYILKFNPSARTIELGLRSHIPAQIIPPIVTFVVMLVCVIDFIGMFLVVYIAHYLFYLLMRQTKLAHHYKKR